MEQIQVVPSALPAHTRLQRRLPYNVAFYKERDLEQFSKSLESLIAHTRRGEMFGEWNDYGRLLDY